MRRLNRNYWRLGWVFLTNGALTLLLLTAPIRVHHDQQLLSEAMRTTPPASSASSYWKELLATPWVPVVALVLLVGIAAEVRRTVLSPIVNLAPYVVWLIVALWERARVAGEATPQELFLGKVLLIIPLVVVIAINLTFYVVAFRRRQAEGGNLGLPSRFS
jgi:hypothetical protein